MAELTAAEFYRDVTRDKPHVVLIGDRLYGCGDTRSEAEAAFRHELQYLSEGEQWTMLLQAELVCIQDDGAEEVGTMLEDDRELMVATLRFVCRGDDVR